MVIVLVFAPLEVDALYSLGGVELIKAELHLRLRPVLLVPRPEGIAHAELRCQAKVVGA